MAKQTKNISSYFSSTTSPAETTPISSKKRKIIGKAATEGEHERRIKRDKTSPDVGDDDDNDSNGRSDKNWRDEDGVGDGDVNDENDENDKSKSEENVQSLRDRWTGLYAHQLPEAAAARLNTQPIWPVQLNHCFARIILDNVVGEGKVPWMERIKAPAVKNLSVGQLEGCIRMAEGVLAGEVDLVEMDGRSLDVRGKKRKKEKVDVKGKAKHDENTIASWKRAKMTGDEDEEAIKALVNSSSKTPYQKRVLLLLLQVPVGHVTTYAALSKHINSSPRAVGNAIRNNPFAPGVPCHRVIAADGSIGGFGGDWGKDGKHHDEKVRLLRGEGVKFDGKGKLVGRVWDKFE